MLKNPAVRSYAVPAFLKTGAHQTAIPSPSLRHPLVALSRCLPTVAWCAEQLDVGWVEQRTAVLQLDDVVAVDTCACSTVWRRASWILATPAALADDGCDQRLPFAGLIGWRCDLRTPSETVRERDDPRSQHR